MGFEFIPEIDEVDYFGRGVGHAFEVGALDDAPVDDREKALDLIEPRCVDGREYKVKSSAIVVGRGKARQTGAPVMRVAVAEIF